MAKRPRNSVANSKAMDRIVNEKHIGIETTDWDKVKPENLNRAIYDNLRNYSVFRGNREAFKWALKWVGKNRKKDLPLVKKMADWEIGTTVGGFCKMHLDGCPLPPRNIDFINRKIDERIAILKNRIEKEKENPKSNISKIDKTAIQVSNFIGTLENVLDDRDVEFSISDQLRAESFTKAMTQKVLNYYKPLLAEADDLVAKNPDVVEGYSNFKTVKSRREYRDFVAKMVGDIEQHIINLDAAKPVRRPKKKAKKVIPKSVMAKNFRYKERDNEYNLVSIKPENMVGASLVYLFNVKTRKMMEVTSSKAEGITFKGASITNFDNAVEKMVRKPEDVIKEIQSGTKRKVQKVFRELTTKEYKYSGLGNKELIILKVFI